MRVYPPASPPSRYVSFGRKEPASQPSCPHRSTHPDPARPHQQCPQVPERCQAPPPRPCTAPAADSQPDRIQAPHPNPSINHQTTYPRVPPGRSGPPSALRPAARPCPRTPWLNWIGVCLWYGARWLGGLSFAVAKKGEAGCENQNPKASLASCITFGYPAGIGFGGGFVRTPASTQQTALAAIDRGTFNRVQSTPTAARTGRALAIHIPRRPRP